MSRVQDFQLRFASLPIQDPAGGTIVVRRNGFTLVELLVVIAIIGVLMAMLLPAVQAARESGRRVTCGNRLRQHALATQQYVERDGAYPGAFKTLTVRGTYPVYATWSVQLLPDLEQQSLYDRYLDGAQPKTPLSVFQCPSDSTINESKTDTSYVANHGVKGG